MKKTVFLQQRVVDSLRPRILGTWYARLLMRPSIHQWVNRNYIKDFASLTDLPSLSAEASRVVEDLQRDGVAFAQFSDLLDEGLFSQLQQSFYEELSKRPDNRRKKPYIVQVVDECLLRENDVFSALVTHPQFSLIVAHYMQMVPRFNTADLWHTLPSEGTDRVKAQRWHRDYDDLLLTKIFICINDVDENNGALEYVRGSHRKGALSNVLSQKYRAPNRPRGHFTDDELRPVEDLLARNTVTCSGKAGTIVFVDTNGFHRGGKLTSGTRDLMVMSFNTNASIARTSFKVEGELSSLNTKFMRKVFGV